MEFINTVPYPLIAVSIFTFGLAIGSFANVCIYRLPKKESVVFPVSHCTACSAPVRPFDNIPVISYLKLGGKCRDCKESISVIYPVIEAITPSIEITPRAVSSNHAPCHSATTATIQQPNWCYSTPPFRRKKELSKF